MLFLRISLLVALAAAAMGNVAKNGTKEDVFIYTPAPSTLKQVTVLFRHGARAPVKLYLHDPNSNPKLWPSGFGQLTQEGLNQAYQLGKWLRSRYGGLLSASWKHTELTARSSAVERSLNSAAATAAGLYSEPLLKNPEERFNTEIPWAPVPVKTTPSKFDQVIDLKQSCKRVEQMDREINATKPVQKYLESLRPLRATLAEQLQQPFDTLKDLGILYDTFKIQQENNLTLLDAVKPLMPQMLQAHKYSLRLVASTLEQKVLRAGPLIMEIIQNMIIKEDGEELRANVSLFSVHDTNIVEQLLVLRSYDNRPPPYASALLFELHQKPFSKKHVVQIYYHNATDASNPMLPLNVPECESFSCPLDDFIQIMQPYMPKDIVEECNAGFEMKQEYPCDLYLQLTIFGAPFIAIVVSAIAYWCMCKVRKVCCPRNYELVR